MPSRARMWFENKRFDWPSVSFFDHWPIRMLGLLPLYALNYFFSALFKKKLHCSYLADHNGETFSRILLVTKWLAECVLNAPIQRSQSTLGLFGLTKNNAGGWDMRKIFDFENGCSVQPNYTCMLCSRFSDTGLCSFCYRWMWLNTKMFILTVDKKVQRDCIIMGYIQTSTFSAFSMGTFNRSNKLPWSFTKKLPWQLHSCSLQLSWLFPLCQFYRAQPTHQVSCYHQPGNKQSKGKVSIKQADKGTRLLSWFFIIMIYFMQTCSMISLLHLPRKYEELDISAQNLRWGDTFFHHWMIQ